MDFLNFSIVDKILFHPPSPPSYSISSYPCELCNLNGTVCLALRAKQPSRKLMIYCHGNASDLGHCRKYLRALAHRLKIHVLCVEYPGYGFSSGFPNEKNIDRCLENVFDFVHTTLGWPKESIILCGRSIGTGPVTKLASQHKIGGLILLAAYTSMKSLIQSKVGSVGNLISERWNSLENIANVSCPVLLFHGIDDKMIPVQNSIELFKACKNPGKTIHILEETGHNRFDWKILLQLILQFITSNEASSGPEMLLTIPRECYEEWGNHEKKICSSRRTLSISSPLSTHPTIEYPVVLTDIATGTGGTSGYESPSSKGDITTGTGGNAIYEQPIYDTPVLLKFERIQPHECVDLRPLRESIPSPAREQFPSKKACRC